MSLQIYQHNDDEFGLVFNGDHENAILYIPSSKLFIDDDMSIEYNNFSDMVREFNFQGETNNELEQIFKDYFDDFDNMLIG